MFYFLIQIYLATTWSVCTTIFIIIAPVIYEAIDIRNAVKQMTMVHPFKRPSVADKDEICNGFDKPKNQTNVTIKKEQEVEDPSFISRNTRDTVEVSGVQCSDL